MRLVVAWLLVALCAGWAAVRLRGLELADARGGVRAFSVHTISGTDHRAGLAELVPPGA